MPRRPPACCALVAVLALGAAAPSARAQTPPAPPSGGTAPARPEVLVVGDSLAVGIRPALAELLPERHLTWSVRSGITTPQGMSRLRRALRRVHPQTVVVSLGTNDGPSSQRFADRIGRTLRAIPDDSCIVWTAIHRARRKGAFRALNRTLRTAAQFDPRLTVIGWDHMIARRSVVLPDGIHPDAAGYDRRAHRYAAEVRRGCAP